MVTPTTRTRWLSNRQHGGHTSLVTLEPKSQPAPRGLIAQVSTSSGSDHTRSQKAPLWGISWLRSIVRIWSKVLMSGERPPWTQSTCSSINWDERPRCHISHGECGGASLLFCVQDSSFRQNPGKIHNCSLSSTHPTRCSKDGKRRVCYYELIR